jgi:hypothetical protein
VFLKPSRQKGKRRIQGRGIACIYGTRKRRTNRWYVGATLWNESRWYNHRYHLRRGTHHSPPFQAAWNFYGAATFKFTILEAVNVAGLAAAFSPSVVIIEYNASLGRTASKVIEYNASHVWRKDRYYGASLSALATLGKRLGYALIGTDRRGVNAFFVRRDLMPVCAFPERAAHEAWRPNLLVGLLPEGSSGFFEP